MKKIKIAIVGVGNCASSLIQSIYLHKKKKDEQNLLYPKIGNYFIEDIDIVAAFDIDERKVGKDISEAIFAKPNNTMTLYENIPQTNIIVQRGPTLDGISPHMKEYDDDVTFKESSLDCVDVAEVLKNKKPDILINYLPVGSQDASEHYANCCLEAGVSFINAIPVFICSGEKYPQLFEEKNLICIGDDIKSQVGATIVHRVLTNLFEKRGVKLTKTYQLNTGGNTDFLNMLNLSRLKSKKISKTKAVQSQMSSPLIQENIHIGPSDYVPWQKDNKICFIRMEGELFGGGPINIDLRLSVEDSPNSAGVMVDIIRIAKLALDNGERGYLSAPSSYGFKHPTVQLTDSNAIKNFEEYMMRFEHGR